MARPPKTLPSSEPAAPAPSQIVEAEVTPRRNAVIATGIAVLLTVVAVILEHLLSNEVPDFHQIDIVQSMAGTATGTAPGHSFLTAVGTFKLDHATETELISILRALTYALMIPLVVLLLRAARLRGGTLGKFLEPVVTIGLALLAIGTVAAGFLEPAFYRHAKELGFTPGDIRYAYKHSSLVFASIPLTIGALAAGVPIALASIQSFRVGLLPTFAGYMGVLIGMLFILPFEPTGLLRALWLSWVAATIAGGMGGLPPAWAAGEAVEMAPRQPRQPRESIGGRGKKGSEPVDVEKAPAAGGKKKPAGKPKGIPG
ncbi:MAG: hypothetical protein AAGC46_08575 [Solirubrobacteraceae bacterium]|nr:hypothetical protein [Patulibacter sp.]